MKTQPTDVNEWMYIGKETPKSWTDAILQSFWALLGYT